MHKFYLAAALLAFPLADAQARVISVHRRGILEISGWQSQSERGDWANLVDPRNISRHPVPVTVRQGGPGAMNGLAFRMETGGWARPWFARTPSFIPESIPRPSTQIICRAAN